jgi:hypothetical protein
MSPAWAHGPASTTKRDRCGDRQPSHLSTKVERSRSYPHRPLSAGHSVQHPLTAIDGSVYDGRRIIGSGLERVEGDSLVGS